MKISDFSKIDSPEAFWSIIPREIQDNIEFRLNIHTMLAKDQEAQEIFLQMCFEKPQIAFDLMFSTYDPRKKAGYKNIPFILYPEQIPVVDAIKDSIDNGHDLIVDKNRDEGATELICKMFALYWICVPQSYFLVGSRKEALVDEAVDVKNGILVGSHKCLMHKILYAITKLPKWIPVYFDKKHLFFQNLLNGAVIEGEATSEGFGAGNRADAVLIDEVAQILPEIAQDIIDNVHDVSPCCIYNSTHGPWGAGHPYAKLLAPSGSGGIPVVQLKWEDNPIKNPGMYRSPDYDIIEIKDINYYRNICPEVFNNINALEPFKFSEFEKTALTYPEEIQEKLRNIRFIADGGESNFKRWRSPWTDYEIIDRNRSPLDAARNIWRVAEGAADMFFDYALIERVRSLYEKEPDYYGEINYDVDINSVTKVPRIKNVKFTKGTPKSCFKWWGNLIKDRPTQLHNYIIACDISRGTGASNSVAVVCDVNVNEIVGLYVNPFIDVTDFAEQALALCKWVGGAYNNPFLIWDAGGPGDTFDHRIRKFHYPFVYVQRKERTKSRNKTKKRGLYLSAGLNGNRLILLNNLYSALMESIKSKKNFKYIVIHDKDFLRELSDYKFDEHRIDVNPSTNVQDSSGAKFAHGDRVIATGLAIMAMEEQPKAIIEQIRTPPKDSFEYRYREWKEEQEKIKLERRNFLF